MLSHYDVYVRLTLFVSRYIEFHQHLSKYSVKSAKDEEERYM